MICVVLAAGYATRLYPLTENFPKPLLEINGKSILDWLLDDIDQTCNVSSHVIISNHKYYGHFQEWSKNVRLQKPVTLLDDGTNTNENRLGAVRDIAFAIDRLSLNDDLLVIAGDNVLDFSFSSFISYFNEKNASCVMRYFEPKVEMLQKSGVALVDKDGLITSMVEKPAVPASNWAIPPFYIYKKSDLPLVAKAIATGCAVDAPGSFIAWLCEQSDVYAMEMPGERYDIGDIESYEQVKGLYHGPLR